MSGRAIRGADSRRGGLPAGAVRAVLIAIAACYALLAHLAVETASVPLTLASVALLLALVLGPGLARGSLGAWTLAIAAGGALALTAEGALAPTASHNWLWLPLYLPAVLGDAFAAWLFGHTLARGRIPLIERMVRLLHGAPHEPIEPEIARYARSLTVVWTVLLSLLGALSFGLALCASPDGVLMLLGVAPPILVPQTAWSWFANVGEYGIVAAFFLGEYAYRCRRFPAQRQPYAGLLDFIRRLAAVAPRLLEPGQRDPFVSRDERARRRAGPDPARVSGDDMTGAAR